MTDPEFEESEFEADEEFTEEAPEQKSNRMFLFAAIGLGGLFVIGLICIGLFAIFVNPQLQGGQGTAEAAFNATSTQLAMTAFVAANTLTFTPEPTTPAPPTSTPSPTFTDTPVIDLTSETSAIPSDTPTPAGPSSTASRTPTRLVGLGTPVAGLGTSTGTITITGTVQPTPLGGVGGGIGGSATPTRLIIGGASATSTATETASTTPEPGTGGGTSETRTPTPTALPDTGFADNFGGPSLFIAAIVLVAVLFFVRQLRLRNS